MRERVSEMYCFYKSYNYTCVIYTIKRNIVEQGEPMANKLLETLQPQFELISHVYFHTNPLDFWLSLPGFTAWLDRKQNRK